MMQSRMVSHSVHYASIVFKVGRVRTLVCSEEHLHPQQSMTALLSAGQLGYPADRDDPKSEMAWTDSEWQTALFKQHPWTLSSMQVLAQPQVCNLLSGAERHSRALTSHAMAGMSGVQSLLLRPANKLPEGHSAVATETALSKILASQLLCIAFSKAFAVNRCLGTKSTLIEPRRTLLQIYGSYKYRRDLASAVHGPGILSRARALKRSEVETLSAPAGKGGAEVPLDPPSMRQAIAWELALRNIRKAEVSCSLKCMWYCGKTALGASIMQQVIQWGLAPCKNRQAEVSCRFVCHGLPVNAQCIWLWLAQRLFLFSCAV